MYNQNFCPTFIGSDEENADSEHYGITCDGCNMYPIIGIRFMCTECFNYDLCSRCKDGDFHPDHDMKKITHSLYKNAEGKVLNVVKN